ncbi:MULTISPECIES: LLM class F420-dependent oxidoreductase [unclassified Nocardioides]|uniref:LLM class F420-dependent oxidoreductase n=1 Tax=unclassified Nocardioides TaxID=2615069 RepID=UPI0006F8F33E|nr:MULTISPECIES: LLM class F420-dependent oxidoreductase [unclassified Nocardioides]KQY50941.1 LLM class F420-dependent oxidoreductase [Nocardioides sp. Root140]KQZ75570.1 LLM class F420-dependent oxidoreductase [Nocardioides sp. Root151]KRF14638.1 LLM class F420-dependent oxidoreductase [Nocardioides sp. Soil796]
MRIGIVSPIVTANPGAHSDWEAAAGIAELATIAEAADRLGFDHLTCSEHVAVPTGVAEQRGATYWDPLVTLSYLAARTTDIRLVTQVLVLGYHHPLEIAKRYGTLDLVSGGRVVLGLGVGSLQEEFDLLGATFEGRGAIADDALKALRASLGRRTPTYHGSHFDFEDLVIEPHAIQEHLPLWIGGRTPRSLRRALTLGDGWVPFGLSLDDLTRMLADADLPDDFQVSLSAGRPLDPIGEPERTGDQVARVLEAGATVVSTAIDATSAGHYVEQLEALAVLAKEI